jgi:GNAT superfamily N-acetyltransferase
MAGSSFTITEENPADWTIEQVALGVDMGNELSEEILPGEPPTPLDAAWAAHNAAPERLRRFSYRAWAADGTLAGAAGAAVDPDFDDNPDVLGCTLSVRTPYRRRGLGLRLLAHVVALAAREGPTRLVGDTSEPLPAGAAFATAMGAQAKLSEHINHLLTSNVDRARLETWVADGPRRAPDYELLSWDGAIPEDHLEAFIDLVHVMNDAPRDDFELNDFTLTPREWREGEEQLDAIKGECWTLVARRTTDGALAGFHDVTWLPHDPTFVYVGATGVRPEHRGHALGKWLKAAMTLRILDERPEVDDIRTGNADSNDAMLGINREMGYRPLLATTGWELDVAAAAARLTERGVDIPTLTRR